MSRDAVLAAVTGLVFSLVANEIGDVSPWLARRILRRASRWEAANCTEADLIFAEQLENLELVPGRLSKLAWALGRLRFGLRISLARATGRFLDLKSDWPMRLVGYGMAAFTAADFGPVVLHSPSLWNIAIATMMALLWIGLAVHDGWQLWLWWQRRRGERS